MHMCKQGSPIGVHMEKVSPPPPNVEERWRSEGQKYDRKDHCSHDIRAVSCQADC